MHSLLDCKECIKNDETKFITKDYPIKSCQEKAKAEEVGWRTKSVPLDKQKKMDEKKAEKKSAKHKKKNEE